MEQDQTFCDDAVGMESYPQGDKENKGSAGMDQGVQG